MRIRLIALVAFSAALAGIVAAQEREDRTLLPWSQVLAIVNEASGERAMHHVLELVPYPRVRPLDEYRGRFRESETMVRLAKEYGFSTVDVESFPQGQRLWQPTVGQLWIVEPELRKLFDIHDVAVSVATNSQNGDVTADLVDVGVGSRPEDYQGRDVKGKIVLGSAGMMALQRQAIFERGAAGVVSYDALRPTDYPDTIPSSSLIANPPQGASVGFGWAVSPRVGRDLAARLAGGQRVRLRSVIRAETFPGRLEVVHATIAGDGSTTQEVAVSGHLFEGYLKQGANDDASGCAVTLEMGRAYIELVKQGKLPRPKRTIRFLWVPEINGTHAWLNAHKDIEQRLIADLNFDMEALRLSTSRSLWVLHRTPDTFPTFLNDIGQSVMEYIAELNRERVRYRANGYVPTYPMVSPNGSRDPFYIKVDQHYGSSDHVTYMQHGIPSLMFITWPDMWYHSSQDTPDKQDPTQYKRAAVVGLAALAVLAGGGDGLATRVSAENLARGTERMGTAERKGTAYLADAGDAAALREAYREARLAVRHQTAVEQAVLKSSAVLYDDPAAAGRALGPLVATIVGRAAGLQNEVKALYEMRAAQLKTPATEPAPTAAETDASRLVVERVPQVTTAGGSFGPFGPGGPGQPAMQAIPQHMRAEFNILIDQKKTALEIRDFLSAEFEPLPLGVLMRVLRELETLGIVKLTTTTP